MIRKRRVSVWVGTLLMRVVLTGTGWVASQRMQRMGRPAHRVILVTTLPTEALHLHCGLDTRGYLPVVVTTASELRGVLAAPMPADQRVVLVVEHAAPFALEAMRICTRLPIVLLGNVSAAKRETLPVNVCTVPNGEARNLRLIEAIEERLAVLKGAPGQTAIQAPWVHNYRWAQPKPSIWSVRA